MISRAVFREIALRALPLGNLHLQTTEMLYIVG